MLRRSTPCRISNWGIHPNMSQGMKGRAIPNPNPPKPTDHGVKKTVLPNGTTVVTHNKEGPTATVGMYVDAGVKYDPASAPGLSYVMRYAMMTSNMSVSMFQIDREFRAVGASYGSTDLYKRYLAWTSDSPAQAWKVAADQFGTAIACPRFVEADIERFRDTMDNALEEHRWQNPREYAVDQLETVAFYKEPLGNPRMVPVTTNDKCNTAALLEKYCSTMTPDRVTVCAINVDHDELCAQQAGLSFQHSSEAPHFQKAKKLAIDQGAEAKQFYGGRNHYEYEQRAKAMCTKPDMTPEAITAVGWRTYGRDEGVAKFATALVAQEMLNVTIGEGLNHIRHATHTGLRTFYRPFSSAGLTGFTVRGEPAAAKQMTADALKALPTDFVSDLQAAKSRAVMSFYNSTLETQQDYANFLATSSFSTEEALAAINSVTTAQVAECFGVMKAETPVLFGTGDVSEMPSLRQFAAKH